MPHQTLRENDEEEDARFMKLALHEAAKADKLPTAFSVGAVLVWHDPDAAGPEILATGYSRELPGNTHAEECCFLKVLFPDTPAEDLPDLGQALKADADRFAPPPKGTCTLYTTMEPCSHRNSGRTSCLDHVMALNAAWGGVGAKMPPINRVVCAVHEPPTLVPDGNTAQHALLKSGVAVTHLPEFAHAALALNAHVI